MNKKTIIRGSDDIILKLKVLAKEKEDTRKNLMETAKQLATTAEEKEDVRLKLAVTAEELRLKAKALAIIAKEKEDVKKKLEVTAGQLVQAAKEKEDIRLKLVETAEELRLEAKALVTIAVEKEEIRRKLAITAQELATYTTRIEAKVAVGSSGEYGKTNAQNEAILASIGDGLVMVDIEGNIIYVNKSFEEMLGWKMWEVVGKSMVEVVPTEDINKIQVQFKEEILSQVLNGKKFIADLTNPFYFIRRDKSRFPVSIIVTSVALGEKIIGAVETFRDITKEKEADRAKTEFVSLASHQLRTPLGIMKWYLEALKKEDYFHKAPQKIKKYIDVIDNGNERELSLVHNLLTISRINEGRVKNVPRLVDLIQVITKTVGQMQLFAKNKKIILKLNVNTLKIPPVNIDTLRFNEVLKNLIVNAIEYTPDSGKVGVVVDHTDHSITITVKNFGLIISAEDQKNLFTKFFRSHEAIRQNPEGTGLGLYIVKSYVEEWGGKVFVESSESKGTTFGITIPLSQITNQK